MRYKLTLDYNGSAYRGSQRQAGGQRTVQGDLEEAVAKLVPRDTAPTVVFAGRTDAGVHASGAVAHVDLERTDKHGAPLPPFTEAALLNALNHHLGERIGVASVRCVPASFHARYSASMRTYVYQIRCAAADAEAAGEEVRRVDACRSLLRRGWLSPLDSHRVFVVDAPLDVAAMRAASAVLLGTHDFTSFRAASCGAKSPVRDLVELSVLEEAPTALAALQSECQRHLAIRVRAKSFLQNQVRYLVATLLQAGQGQITADGVAQLLAARDNRRAPTLAPAHGLYLARVEYPEASYVASTAPPPPAADEDDSDDAEGPPAKRQAVT